MIRELQISTFMKEKVSFLTALARDIASRLHLIDTEIQADDGDVLLDERDVAELLASLETMNNDPSLWEPTSDRWLPRSAYAGLLQASVEEYYRANQAVEDAPDAFGERL